MNRKLYEACDWLVTSGRKRTPTAIRTFLMELAARRHLKTGEPLPDMKYIKMLVEEFCVV
jgi:hypothetical protein